LAIVKCIVEMHQGLVHAHSDGEGLGVRMVLDLPAIAQPQAAPAAPPLNAASAAGKLLVVDDNRDAADLAAVFLESAGYEARVAYHPDEALAMLDGYEPDLALLDIGLPGMSGYELARRWREHPSGRGCKLIALTGYAQTEDIERARQSGFDAHLSKPAEPGELLEKIGHLLTTESGLVPG
jgi:CheY-like chemotaxis protein